MENDRSDSAPARAQVVDLDSALRRQVNAMADMQMAMQEYLPMVPRAHAAEYLALMDAHAIKLARLASRLYSEGSRQQAIGNSSEAEVDYV